jgi:BirA family biotin operon repressor/biotin-[acetyl-CoA-carboxylase] ligase
LDLASDLSALALMAALPERPIRTYPALLSTEADALAWVRAGAPEGALVVADYQVAARGRGGLPWEVRPGLDLSFSLVLRPRLAPEREGWLYTVATSALADVLGEESTIEWPDEVRREGDRIAAVGVQAELGPEVDNWAVVTFLVPDHPSARAGLLAELVEAIEARYGSPSSEVLSDYVPRCETVGRMVRARLIPLGPNGQEVTGRAVSSLKDGALVIETPEDRRMIVRPQALGLLEEPIVDEEPTPRWAPTD